MDALTAGIVSARLDGLLVQHGFPPDAPEALLLVDPRSASVLWASPAARAGLSADDPAAIERALFHDGASGRAYAARLKRLPPDAAFRLDRLVLPARPGPVVVACHPVRIETQALALLHIRGMAAKRSDAPVAALPVTATTPPAQAPSRDAVLPVTRIAWEIDAAGHVVRLGPDMRRLGRRAPRLGDDLPDLLRPFAPLAADRLVEAATQPGAVGLIRIDWPSGDASPLLVELGYAGRRGASGGLRGVFTVHGAIDEVETVEETEAAEPAAASEPVEPEPADPAAPPLPDAAAPDAQHDASADITATDAPAPDSQLVPAAEGLPAGPSRGNVVHFPVMRLGPVPANFGAPLRPTLLPDHASAEASNLQAPQWSEAPRPDDRREAVEPEGLSADERDAFDHIRKVLGTRPFAPQPQPQPARTDPVLPPGIAALLDGVPVALHLAAGGTTVTNTAWRNRADPDRSDGTTATFELAGTSATLTVLPVVREAPPRASEAAVGVIEALDLVGDGSVRLDENGTVRALSPKAGRLLGIKPFTAVGRSFASFLFDGQAPGWQALAAVATGPEAQPQGPSALRLRHVAGQAVAVLVRLARIDGALLCALTLDRPAASPANDTAEAARREAERTSALKSEFLAKVSHEIRTPLNAILGFAEVIRDERLGPVGNARYLEYLRDIHASGTHVMSLVNDLLDLSRIEAGRMDLNLEAVDANAVVQSCVNTLQTQAHRDRVIVRLSLTPRLPPTLADERSLRQIVLNLLSNAIKFNEPGGQVIVSTALAGPHAVAIRIRDTGIGMTDDEIEAAMEPFRQISTVNRTGSGLGLPLTKALVEANCASMTIKSTRGEGTLVEVTFPLVEQDSVSLPAE